MTTLFIITAITLFTTVLCELFFLLLIWRKRKSSAAHRAFFLFIFFIMLWSVSIFVNLFAQSMLIESILFASGTIALTAQLWFVHFFTKQRKPSKLFQMSTLTACGALVCASFWNGAIFTALTVMPEGYTIITNGPLAGIHSLFVVTTMLLTIILLYKKYRRTKRQTLLHTQLYFLLWGFTIFFCVTMLINSALPVFFHFYLLNAFGPVFFLALIAFVAHIITRHRFLDIRPTLQHLFFIIIFTTLILLFYCAVTACLIILFNTPSHITAFIAGGITTLLSISIAPHTKKYLYTATNALFFAHHYNSSHAFAAIGTILRKNLDLTAVIHDITYCLEQTLHIKYASVLMIDDPLFYHKHKLHKSTPIVTDNIRGALSTQQHILLHNDPNISPPLQKFFTHYNIGIIVPLIGETQKTTSHFLLLGHKKSDDLYTQKDVRFLRMLADHITAALEKSRLYEKEKEYARTLKQKVEERTQHIHAMQEERKQMLLDIAHSIQTPLTVVRGEVEAIYKDLPEKKMKVVEEAVDRVSFFIARLLKLARLSAHVETAPKGLINLSVLIEDQCEYFATVFAQRNIILTHDITSGLFANANADYIKEVITTITENAVKYMGNGPRRAITITAHRTNSRSITIAITDTGHGIAREDLPHVFKQFYRGKTKTAALGSGLGLAVAKKIVLYHDGTIDLVSREGHGTTVTITLPIQAQQS